MMLKMLQRQVLPQAPAQGVFLRAPGMFAAVLLLLGVGLSQANAQDRDDQSKSTETSICSLIEAAAQTNGLPVEFFTRLIWQESRFRADEIGPVTRSGARAQGIAQFMPGTALERQLYDPFNPVVALPKSSEFLAELKAEFGNLGLAAAAYNAGPQRVRDFLAGGHELPSETRNYVITITGHSVEDWAASAKGLNSPTATTLALRTEGEPVSCRNVVTQLAQRSNPILAQWRNVPSWCKGLHHPNPAICGPVHMAEWFMNPAVAMRVKSHVHLARARAH